jgi:DNA-binding beta-propeller fold protein YncE
MPGGFAINPLNGDLLVVNLADNNLVELNMTQRKVVGVKQIDPAVVDAQGNGSALFGVAASKDDKGNLRVFFTDDNTNTLDVLKTS